MTKEFKLICMRSLCDQKVFSVWKDENDVRGTSCPKCGHNAAMVRVPEPEISPGGENVEDISNDETSSQREEDNMLKNLEELQRNV